MTAAWYHRWFGEAYKKLYPHRDYRQARIQVEALLKSLPVQPEWRILDAGCGAGRHLEVFLSLRFYAVGLDLSFSLLRDARGLDLPVIRGDIRRLPLRPSSFELLTCFFTSFGYFATLQEDVDVLAQFADALVPGGHFFLDLPNKNPLLRNLVPFDSGFVEGVEMRQSRRLENGTVVKEIEIRSPSGQVEKFEERVRLFGMDEIVAMAERFSFRLTRIFGDETGVAYHPETSPRMALLFRKDA